MMITDYSSWTHLTATGNHIPYGITQCYLPPGRGDFPAFTPAETGTRFSDPEGIQDWVNLGGGYIPWIVYPKETITYLKKTGNAVTGIRAHDRESQVRPLTTTPPSHRRLNSKYKHIVDHFLALNVRHSNYPPWILLCSMFGLSIAIKWILLGEEVAQAQS